MTARIPLVINSGAIQELQSGDSFNLGTGATLISPVITGTGTAIFSQVNIVGQGDVRFEDASGGQYVAFQAPATIPTSYTLTWPDTDGSAGQALVTDGTGVLSWSTAAAGDVYGPASATDNAVARFDGTTGKLIQNSAVTIGDDGATVIAANSTSDGLRITQIGSGNALVVEDSANPDSTPFAIDSTGLLLSGGTASVNAVIYPSRMQINAFYAAQYAQWAADNTSSNTFFLKSRNATVGSHTIVQSGDVLGRQWFAGSDGTQFVSGALIEAAVDGTPGTNDMPGRLVFSTTADGASSPTERMRIDNGGFVGIGATSTSYRTLRLGKNPTGNTFYISQIIDGTIQSDVTSQYRGISAYTNTQSAAFTLGNSYLYVASQGTIGAGSAVTNQIGFFAESNLTGATNNYGFYSNIASGTGRFNFYAAGSADNYFAGSIGIKALPVAGYTFIVGGSATGATTGIGALVNQSVQSDVTSAYRSFQSTTGTAAASFTLSDLTGFAAFQGTIGAGSSVTNQYGFYAGSNITGATNNYSFYGLMGFGTNRYNLYMAGTADNYVAGRVGFGGTSMGGAYGMVTNQLTVTGATASASYGAIYTIASDVTAAVSTFKSQPTTQAAAFTLGLLTHFSAEQYGFGAGSTVTNQYGFHAIGGLTGATNNYGFVSALPSGTGRYNFYAGGTADNYFAGKVGVGAAPPVAGVDLLQSGGQLTAAINTSANIEPFFVAKQNSASAGAGGGIIFGAQGGSFAAIKGLLTNGTGNWIGDLAFSTRNATGDSTLTERMRIDSAGRVGIGQASAGSTLNIQKSATGGANIAGVYNVPSFQSDVTGAGVGFWTNMFTAAASFTMSNMQHFRADQGTIGAGSTVTTQQGFIAGPSLTGATNNYGFYSQIASGTGRYNFYAAGTAENYFAGNVGIGVGSGGMPLNIGSTVDPLGLSRFAANANGPFVFFNKSRSGTVGTQTVVQNGDDLGGLAFQGSDGTNWIRGAAIFAQVDGTPGTNDMPGRLIFQTTADGASSGTERMRIDSSGNVLVTSSGGLGYGTGSGGAVTQITSRTTGVTLNKTNGAITLVSAAGSATVQSFTVTNSTVAATDTIIINQKSGTDLYEIHITAVAAGSFRVSFKTTGGTTTEQPVFNFAVIKAVTA